MQRTALALLTAFVLASVVRAQEAEEVKLAKKRNLDGKIVIEDPGAKIPDSKIAREKVEAFKKAFEEAKEGEKRAALVKELGNFDHPEILKEAEKLVDSKDRLVAIQAAVVCGRQTDKRAGATIFRKLLREKRTDVVSALLVAMGKVHYDNRAAIRVAMKWFKKDKTSTHLAAVRYLGLVKDKDAFRPLAEELDSPRPSNPNDPNNPPASWWRERWIEWRANIDYVKKALSEIVPGETFDTTQEAKNWAENHGRKLGIRW